MAAAQNLTPRKEADASSTSELHQRILDSTVELFVEVGYAQVTTNLIAQRADVSVGSIYRFYPNKFAIFNTIVENFFAALDRHFEAILATLEPDCSPGRQIDIVGERMQTLWLENRTLIKAWGVLSGNPEIAKADSAHAERSTQGMANYLAGIIPGRSPEQCHTTSRMIYWLTLATFDAAVRLDDFDHAIVAEYSTMLKGYIRSLTDENASG